MEHSGKVIGELVDSQFADMFWDSYCPVPNSVESASLFADERLWQACQFKFRNRGLDEFAPNAFAACEPVFRDGRIHMRGLYLVPNGIIERAAFDVFCCLRSLNLMPPANKMVEENGGHAPPSLT